MATNSPPSAFHQAVLAVVAEVPQGVVVTYAEVAAEAGHPGAARAVGTVLRRMAEPVPWWRVVTADGRLVPGFEQEHAGRLRAEEIALVGGRVARQARPGTDGRPSQDGEHLP